MPRTKKIKQFIIWFLALVVLAICSAYFLIGYFTPAQKLAESRIKKQLERLDLQVNSFEIENFSNSNFAAKNINLGSDEKKLIVENISAGFDISKILSGKINNLKIENAELNFYKKENKFLIAGLEGLMNKKSAATSKTSTQPDFAIINKFAPTIANIKNLKINAASDVFNFDAIINSTIENNNVKITAENLSFAAKPYNITANNGNISADLSTNKLVGNFSIPSIKISNTEGENKALELNLDISFEVSEQNFVAQIKINNADKTLFANANINLPFSNISDGVLDIKSIEIPLNIFGSSGVISANNIMVALDLKKEISTKIILKNVDLKTTLEKFAEGKISGTGKISGEIPIVFNPETGFLTLNPTELKGIENGQIAIAPELLPGENSELQFARQTLENFNYTKLKILLSSNEKSSSVVLAVEGKPLNSADGRQVNLNVNLSGDIIPLIQQSILPINDIKKFLNPNK
jgi:hypothetical protein